MQNTRKNVFLLHPYPSGSSVAGNFRDALTTKASGSIRVTHFASIYDDKAMQTLTLEWLDQVNNILLICLTSESIPRVEQIIREKQLADESGTLHEKLFTVSFGGWPPDGLHRGGSLEERDFYFGFPDPENVQPQAFERSSTMAALVAAIVGTN